MACYAKDRYQKEVQEGNASGEAHEQAERPEEALSRYSEAGALASGGRYSHRADLRAGDILVRQHRKEEARVHFTRVIEATPESEEGQAARRALRQISSK